MDVQPGEDGPDLKIRMKHRNVDRYVFFVIALISLVTLGLIVYFIFAQAAPFLQKNRLVPEGQGTIVKYGETFTPTKLGDLFTSRWRPESDVEEFFGMLPMIVGTTVVTLGAMLLAIPFGLSAAIFVGEVGPRWMKDVFKAILELLAAVPSIVYGFFGLIVLSPYVREAFNLVGGKTGATAAIILSIMALPTIASLAEDALHAVPNTYREASLALGATKWQTIWRTIVPSSSSGIIGAGILGMGRAVGETMAVLFVAGNAPFLTWNIFRSLRPITSGIALDMLESVRGSAHYHSLFAMGAVLLLIALAMNWTAEWFHVRLLRRQGIRGGGEDAGRSAGGVQQAETIGGAVDGVLASRDRFPVRVLLPRLHPDLDHQAGRSGDLVGVPDDQTDGHGPGGGDRSDDPRVGLPDARVPCRRVAVRSRIGDLALRVRMEGVVGSGDPDRG